MPTRTTLWTLAALLLGLTATGHAASSQTDQRSTRTGTVFFLGIITSVNVSNRTITVDGAESVVVNTVVQDKKNNKVTSSQVQKSIQTIGNSDILTFEVGGLCRIEVNENEQGKLGRGIVSIADRKVGDKVQVEYIKGIGERLTARFIRSAPNLPITKAPPKK